MLPATTSTMLRAGVTRSCTPLLLLRSQTTTPYSTLISSPLGLRPTLADKNTKPATLFRPSKPSTTIRPASTAAQQDARAAASAAAVQSTPLTWDTFFKLRATRRWWQLACSIIFSATGGAAGAVTLSTGAADFITSQVPLDPFLTLGLMTFGAAALGWLVGPTIGNQLFYVFKRQQRAQMIAKEAQFFARIKKNRVDPSVSSAANPVPDFYGEKISSVAGYRQWLKDQRAFRKKRTVFV